MNTIPQLQQEAWQIAEDKGFHTDCDALGPRYSTMVRLALIHTEVSETTQEVKRHGITCESVGKLAEELADTIIRIFDLAECLDVSLEHAILAKMEKNRGRPHMYGTPEEIKP
jgi:NTP pyrophosphatase (non-canonical NTP hydrolase)